jgi:subtilisin-like proprotein convertase family protein
MRSIHVRTVLLSVLILAFVFTMLPALADGAEVRLRSGVIQPGRQAEKPEGPYGAGTQRWVVRFQGEPGWHEKGAIESRGAKIETPLPGNAYLVSIPAADATTLTRIPRVDWATPYLPQNKIAPEIASLTSGAETSDEKVIVLVHLFADADVRAFAKELTTAGLQVDGARAGSRFGRIVMRMTPAQVASHRAGLAEREEVFWIERRHRRVLTSDETVWVVQSGLDGGMTTPIFDQGLYGDGQIAAVLDTGIDADDCHFSDGTLGLPPTNTGGGTTVDLNQRKVIAVDFLDPSEDPADPTHWDTHGHGSHVAGIAAGDDLANGTHDGYDGMAPGAKLVIQDAGYQADDCGDLPGLGCPVTDLIPIFQQAYDQGARFHNNSWNDNENAEIQNRYTDASQDVDEFMWQNPDFLIMFGAGNQGYPVGNYGKIGSPGTAKNGMSVGATLWGQYANILADLSSYGYTDDGRIKPDILVPGQSINSAGNDGDVTTNACNTAVMGGTSMASPGAVGTGMLVRQYYMEGWYPTGAPVPGDAFTPSAALVKGTLMNGPVSLDWDNGSVPMTAPAEQQGWGRIHLDNSLHFAGETRKMWVDDHTDGFTSPSDPAVLYQLEVTDPSEPLRVTLSWTDYPSTPAASTHLVNDLDLRVDGASGSFFGNYFIAGQSASDGAPDRLNNVEQVFIETPTPGVYAIEISAHAVPMGPQPWALVVTGGGLTVTSGPRPAYRAHVIDDSGPGGNGDGVLDPGETAIIPVTLRNSGDADANSTIAQMYSANPDLLKVYGNVSGYGDLPPGTEASSSAPHYSVTLEPAATCGQVVGTSLGITGDGFDVTSAFTIDAGVRTYTLSAQDTPVEIPRNDSGGVSSWITVPDIFPYDEVDVTVSIDHDDISELQVILYAPGNQPAGYLHNRTGAGVSGLHTTYDDETEPAGVDMRDFVLADPSGNWRLRVIDEVHPGAAPGTLLDWSIRFKHTTIPFNCTPVGCGEAVPPAVGDTLHVHKSGSSDIQVTWDGVGASDYNVWRSEDGAFKTAVFQGSTGGSTSHVDAGAQVAPAVLFYQVRATNSCRWEGP